LVLDPLDVPPGVDALDFAPLDALSLVLDSLGDDSVLALPAASVVFESDAEPLFADFAELADALEPLDRCAFLP
jgi:hypothetical protein